MKKVIYIFIFLIFLISNSFANEKEITKNSFKYYLDLENPKDTYKFYKVHLSEEIIEKSANKLKDLRLFYSNNKVPFVILNDLISKPKSLLFDLEIDNYEEKNNKVIIITKLTKNNLEKLSSDISINFNLDNIDFERKVNLFGSNNKLNWALIKSDTIYDFSSNIDFRKTKIDFNSKVYKYYKIELVSDKNTNINETLKLQYEKLKLSFNNELSKSLKINNIFVKNINKSNKTTIYDSKELNIKSIYNEENKTTVNFKPIVDPHKLFFQIDNQYYYRKVRIYGSDIKENKKYDFIKSEKIYKLKLGETNKEKNYLKLSGTNYQYYKLIVDNLDNEPLDIKSIKYNWIRKNLVFFNTNYKNPQLNFGNERVSKANYDLPTLINQNNWFKQEVINLNYFKINENLNFSITGRKFNPKNVLIIIIFFITFILLFWLYSLVKVSTL